MKAQMIEYEHEQAEPLRVESDNEGEIWLRGYADGYHARDLATPARHVEMYLRGYLAGLQAGQNSPWRIA